jgi:hypothetical protein
MVKGRTKRIVVVKSPDPRYFDEAIFFIKEGIPSAGQGAEGFIRSAERAAAAYADTSTPRPATVGRKKLALYAFITGLLFASALWAVAFYLMRSIL